MCLCQLLLFPPLGQYHGPHDCRSRMHYISPPPLRLSFPFLPDHQPTVSSSSPLSPLPKEHISSLFDREDMTRQHHHCILVFQERGRTTLAFFSIRTKANNTPVSPLDKQHSTLLKKRKGSSLILYQPELWTPKNKKRQRDQMTSSCPVALSPHFWFYYYFLIVRTCNRGFSLLLPSPHYFFFTRFFRIESPTFTPMPIAHWWWELGNIATRSCFHSHSLTHTLSQQLFARLVFSFVSCGCALNDIWQCLRRNGDAIGRRWYDLFSKSRQYTNTHQGQTITANLFFSFLFRANPYNTLFLSPNESMQNKGTKRKERMKRKKLKRTCMRA